MIAHRAERLDLATASPHTARLAPAVAHGTRPSEADFATAVRAIMAERLPAFGVSWLAPMVVWALAMWNRSPAAGPLALATLAFHAVAVALALAALQPADVRARADRVAFGLGLVLAFTSVPLFVRADAIIEVVGFVLYTLCSAAAVLFPWGWRKQVAFIIVALTALALASLWTHTILGWVELAPVVTIAAMLCIAIAEGNARSFRTTLARRWSEEAALRELAASRDNYRDLTEHARDSIWAVDIEGRITYINEAGARFLGSTPPALIGKNVDDRITDHPLNPSPDAMRAILMAEAALSPTVLQLETAAGRYWLEMVAYAVRSSSGEVIGFRGISRDVTARWEAEAALRESEARYRGLVESQEALIYRADFDGTLTFVNEACRRKFGTLHEPVGTLNLLAFVHPDDIPFARAAMQGLARGGRYRRISRSHTPQGWRWIEWEVCAINDADGRVTEVQGVGHDVTERRAADEALQQSLAVLREREEQLRLMGLQQVAIREEERKRLSFDLHDGVCQELVGIGILIESARRRGVSESADPTLVLAQGHLREVGEHIRLMARDLRPLQLSDLGLTECLRALANGMASERVQVTASFPTAIPRLGEEIEVAVYRVAQEAVANAVRHARARTVTLVLAATDGMLRLEVRDDGRGFARDELRAAALGLVAMEERAIALGGRLQVHSESGAGTTVTLECPLGAA